MILENDVIDEYDLEEDRIVSMSEMSKLKENDLIQKRISKCLTKLVQQDYSIAQMREYLEQFDDSYPELNQEVIKYLETKGFLDDERFIYELLERYQRKGYGKYRFEKNLGKYQFNQELLDVVMEIVYVNQAENLLIQYDEISKRKFEGSLISVKTKIAQRLIRLGFEASRVNELVLNAHLEYDESISLRKDFKKISQKETDPFKIQQKLRQKGYLMENIKQVMGD